MSISYSELKRLLHYNAETGIWHWLIALARRTKVGRPLKASHADGYVVICIRGKLYLSANLAWFYMTGEWPTFIVDHKNNIPNDDRWSNFRRATKAQNRANAKATANTITRLKGVHKNANRFQARIGSKSNRSHLGSFDCPAAAHFAYLIEADKRFGEFARAR